MSLYKRWILLLCLVLTLLLAACSGEESTPEEPSESSAETSEGTDEATDEGEVAEPEVEIEVEVPATPTVEALDLSNAKTLDEVADINSFRLRVNIKAEGEAFEGEDAAAMLASGINVEGSFIKEPISQHIVMGLGEGLGTLEFVQVDNKGYAKFGETWSETEIDQAPKIEDLAFLTPADLANGLDQFENKGDETVNGRETVHLYADKEVFKKLETGDEEIGIDQAEEVMLNLWFDKSDGFIVKMEIVAEGKGLSETDAEATGRVEMTLEYYDFNEEIVIETPEI